MAQRHSSFEQLQNRLREHWHNDTVFGDDVDILVVPSFSLDQRVGQKVPGFIHYEERLLFSLIRLRNPHTRLIYVTAQPFAPLIVDYYLQLLSGIPFSQARERLMLLTTYDASPRPLTQKILDRPRLMEKIKRSLRPHQSYMVCFNGTPLEMELSERLQIPLFASGAHLRHWGSKSGSREIFAAAGIPHPPGTALCFSPRTLAVALAQLWQRHPDLSQVVIKLNEGFSGEGNALFSLPSLENPQAYSPEALATHIETHWPQLQFQAPGETWENFAARMTELGAIAEMLITGTPKTSPSVQGMISPTGEVTIRSTHDQILGGQSGQIYLGCHFPAHEAYRLQLQEWGLKVGKVLAQKGAMECFGVDFVAVKTESTWQLYAIEINLRKGGTTHPFMTLKFLTNGQYHYDSGSFFTPQGKEKCYVASDNLQKPQYRGLLPGDLMDIIAKHHLHFDSSTKTGTIFHLMGTLSEFGKLGLTSIGNDPKEAQDIYHQVETALDQETSPQTLDNISASLHSMPIRWSSR